MKERTSEQTRALIKAMYEDSRKRYWICKHDLQLFALWYFGNFCTYPDGKYQKEAWKILEFKDERDFFLDVEYRESGKTGRALIKILHAIAYKKHRFITYYCFDKAKARARLFDIAVQLQSNERFIKDFGSLFFEDPLFKKRKKSEKKAIGEFITENDVKVKAFSIGESPRGEMYAAPDGIFRPSLIILDDVDVLKSVRNPKIIDKNYEFIKEEILAGADAQAKKIFLGNIISSDGVVPRLLEEAKSIGSCAVMNVPAEIDGVPTWDRFVKTDAEAREINSKEKNQRRHVISLEKKRRDLGEIAYNRNFLNIPFSGGDSIIKRDYIQRIPHSIVASYWQDFEFFIGLDPAVSEKTKSDPFAINVACIGEIKDPRFAGVKKISLESHELVGKEKDIQNAIAFIKRLYNRFADISGKIMIRTENVAFQAVLEKLLQAEGLACVGVSVNRDKVTRLMEKQAEIERGDVLFDEDGYGNAELIEQLIAFPDSLHDDRVDAFLHSIAEDDIVRHAIIDL